MPVLLEVNIYPFTSDLSSSSNQSPADLKTVRLMYGDLPHSKESLYCHELDFNIALPVRPELKTIC